MDSGRNPGPTPSGILSKELDSYSKLIGMGIHVPKLIDYDTVQDCIVKEYIDGESVLDLVLSEKMDENCWKRIFSFSQTARNESFNLDYLPGNYILCRGNLYYIDYDVLDYSAEWSFENWGIYYWINIEGMKNYFETGEDKYLHVPDTNYKPTTNATIEIRRSKMLGQFGLELSR